MNENLYQAPSAPISARGYDGNENLPAGAIEQLLRTQFWVRFVSVVGLIFSLLIVGSMFLQYAAFRQRFSNGAPVLGPMLFVTAVMFILTIYPLIRLSKYASAIAHLRITRRSADFENALLQQRLFWRFIGVLLLIGVGFWLLVFLIAFLQSASRY